MSRGEGCSAFHSPVGPVLRGGDVLHLDGIAEADVATLFQGPNDFVAVPVLGQRPIDGGVEIGCGEQDVVDVLAVRGQIGVRATRVGHQQAWIAHELLAVDQILEDALP